MGGWRAKLVFLLIVYFAGFATAIYCLAPAGERQNVGKAGSQQGVACSAVKSEDFAGSFSSGLHKCLDISKDAAQRAGRFIKQKIDESRVKTSG